MIECSADFDFTGFASPRDIIFAHRRTKHIMTFSGEPVELVNVDLEVVVKVIEVQNDVRDVVVVAVDPPVGAAGRLGVRRSRKPAR